ncbi:hypothetical protein MC885_012746 [Smutsia gigantea]|nr:hypothetical protein MC885_012746 [Smutsia gigantea]
MSVATNFSLQGAEGTVPPLRDPCIGREPHILWRESSCPFLVGAAWVGRCFRYKSLSHFSLHRRRQRNRLSEGHKAKGMLPGPEPLVRAVGQLASAMVPRSQAGLVGGPGGEGVWRKWFCPSRSVG